MAVVTQVQPGVVLLITIGQRQGSWWQVEGSGITGWVSSRYLRRMH